MKLTRESAEAIVRLQNNADFKILKESLQAYRHELFEFVMYGQSSETETYRGMARSITEVQRALGGAQEFLEKSRNRR